MSENSWRDRDRDKDKDKEISPDFLRLARKYLLEGNYIAAELYCHELLKKHGDNVEVHMNLGSALLNQNRIKEAEKSFRTCIDLCDENCQPDKKSSARYNLAICLGYQYGKEDQTEEIFLKLIQEDQGNAYIYQAYADFLGRNDRSWEEKAALEKAIDIFCRLKVQDPHIILDYVACMKKLNLIGGDSGPLCSLD